MISNFLMIMLSIIVLGCQNIAADENDAVKMAKQQKYEDAPETQKDEPLTLQKKEALDSEKANLEQRITFTATDEPKQPKTPPKYKNTPNEFADVIQKSRDLLYEAAQEKRLLAEKNLEAMKQELKSLLALLEQRRIRAISETYSSDLNNAYRECLVNAQTKTTDYIQTLQVHIQFLKSRLRYFKNDCLDKYKQELTSVQKTQKQITSKIKAEMQKLETEIEQTTKKASPKNQKLIKKNQTITNNLTSLNSTLKALKKSIVKINGRILELNTDKIKGRTLTSSEKKELKALKIELQKLNKTKEILTSQQEKLKEELTALKQQIKINTPEVFVKIELLSKMKYK